MSLDSTQYSNYIISALARCRLSAIVYQTKKKEVLNLDLQNKAKARDKPIFWAFNGLAKPDHAKKTHVRTQNFKPRSQRDKPASHVTLSQ